MYDVKFLSVRTYESCTMAPWWLIYRLCLSWCIQLFKEDGFLRLSTRCSLPPPVRWPPRSPPVTVCRWPDLTTAICPASCRCCSAPSRIHRRLPTPPPRAHRPEAAPAVRTLRRRRLDRRRLEVTACSSRRTTSWASRTSVSWLHACSSAPSNGRGTYRSFPIYRSQTRHVCYF